MRACVLYFQGLAHILDSSELFAVAALHWKDEIKHVGVCSEVQEPARDSDSGSISTVEEEITCVCALLRSFHIMCVRQ